MTQKSFHPKYQIVPPAMGIKRVAARGIGKAIPKVVKVVGQAKKLKVSNPLGARQVQVRRPKARFRVRK